MAHQPSRRAPPLTIHDPRAITLLLNPLSRSVLSPFFGEGSTVAQAAACLGVKPNTLLKQVKKLVTWGLLRVRNQQRRAGRAVKRYQVTAERFFVPFAATDALTLGELLARSVEEPHRLIAQGIARLYAAQPGTGYLVSCTGKGKLVHDFSADGLKPDDPQTWCRDGWVVRLTPERTQAFIRDLLALKAHYQEDTGTPHLAYVALAPLSGQCGEDESRCPLNCWSARQALWVITPAVPTVPAATRTRWSGPLPALVSLLESTGERNVSPKQPAALKRGTLQRMDRFWQLDYAQRLAQTYRQHLEVCLVMVGGSVARRQSDRFSDLELGVFWQSDPTE